MTKSKGFSLIELLVVISIIGILVAMSIFGLTGARASARDAKRKGDLEQVRSAIEIYKADCNVYPASNQLVLSSAGSLVGNGSTTSCLAANLYLTKPMDPVSSYSYRYNQLTSNTYELCAFMEAGGTSVACGGNCGTNACNYKVTQP